LYWVQSSRWLRSGKCTEWLIEFSEVLFVFSKLLLVDSIGLRVDLVMVQVDRTNSFGSHRNRAKFVANAFPVALRAFALEIAIGMPPTPYFRRRTTTTFHSISVIVVSLSSSFSITVVPNVLLVELEMSF